jgi:hypothetical protein
VIGGVDTAGNFTASVEALDMASDTPSWYAWGPAQLPCLLTVAIEEGPSAERLAVVVLACWFDHQPPVLPPVPAPPPPPPHAGLRVRACSSRVVTLQQRCCLAAE